MSFSDEFVSSVKQANATSIEVTEPVEIIDDVYLTGEMGSDIMEQSLILRTGDGLVVITGCSHPGIVEILEKTKEILDEDIYMAFGGFHLLRHSDEETAAIIDRFQSLGVEKCGAGHCTGEEQIAAFQTPTATTSSRLELARSSPSLLQTRGQTPVTDQLSSTSVRRSGRPAREIQKP